MGLSDKYCNEVSSAFDLIAIYLPGSKIKIGDIIKFDKQKLLTNKRGVFTRYSSLKNKEISFASETSSTMSDLMYSTKGSVEVNTKILAKNIAKIDVKFKSEGSVYFNALKCKEEDISNFINVKKELHEKSSQDENGLYVVTKLITAKRAIIMQSSINNGSLSFKIDNKTINSNADIGVSVSSVKNHSLVVEAEKDVTVLMGLHQIKISKKQKKVESQIKATSIGSQKIDNKSSNILIKSEAKIKSTNKPLAVKKAAAPKKSYVITYAKSKNSSVGKCSVGKPKNINVSYKIKNAQKNNKATKKYESVGQYKKLNGTGNKNDRKVMIYKVNASRFFR